MSVNIAEVRERLSPRLSEIQQIDESIIRGVRKIGETPFAIYYFVTADKLPDTREALTKYQDQVIGGRYFGDEKSLQWNNYLYFILDRNRFASSDILKAKELIENDRNYARKLVISEDDLESVLSPAIVTPAGAVPPANVLSVWVERLVNAGLDKAILNDQPIPSRLELIESSSRPSSNIIARRRRTQVAAEPFIRSFELKTFRRFPLRRYFEFGAVNLIVGANGTGKTSLLEAIELFYCGKNKRNPSWTVPYELVASFENGKTENASASRPLQLFRDRNLNWYGQSEVKSSNLYQSFAQFNFLDTDAAVHLADSSSDAIEDDLSKLLVGPEASKTWREMERVNEGLVTRLKSLRPLEKQLEEMLVTFKKQLTQASSVNQGSDLIFARLEQMLQRLGWTYDEKNKYTVAGRFLGAVTELVSLARQAEGFNWTEKPVSIDGLTKYCRESRLLTNRAEAQIEHLATLHRNVKRQNDAIARNEQALDVLKEVKRFIDLDIPARVAIRDEQRNSVAIYSGWLAGLEPNTLAATVDTDQEISLDAWHKELIASQARAQRQLAAARSEYSNFSRIRNESFNLMQELRQIASKILNTGADPDECPLCHTRFAPGELPKHMLMGVDEHLEKLGQEFLDRINVLEVTLRSLSSRASAAGWLVKFCDKAKLSLNTTLSSVSERVETARQALAHANSDVERVSKELDTLEAQGWIVARLEENLQRLRELGRPLTELSAAAVDQLNGAVAKEIEESSSIAGSEQSEIAKVETELSATLGSADATIRSLRSTLGSRREMLVTTESVRAKLVDCVSLLSWPFGRPLAELVVEAESVRDVAAELQDALNRERSAQSTLSEATKRIDSLNQQLNQIAPRIKRLNEAKSVLDRLQEECSLDNAMASALQQNRAAIGAIFSKIHSPAEFRGLGTSLTTLVRKVDGSEAQLSEISTGQRAAFALSIFLAQNTQLTIAPPVILIDDPIAHVDDLNSLSFLDYLRDLTLTTHRQIYFATASDKLAALFQRKFDFLGKEGFRRFDLWRELN